MSHISKRKSESSEQKAVESPVLRELNLTLGICLKPAVLQLGEVTVEVDGYDEDGKVVCEIYAHVGKLIGAQPDKVDSDVLKMLLIERHKGGSWRKIQCLVCERACEPLRRNSWRADVRRVLGVEVIAIQVQPDLHQALKDAQLRQRMINQS